MTFPLINGKKVFPLGFGLMRLPILKDGKIDNAAAGAMVEKAVDSGVNYFDTAYPYHNEESELFAGKYITPLMREKVAIATKLPTWMVKSRIDMDKFLNEQLQKLKTDCIDFYLLHSLNLNRWDDMQRYDVLEFLDRAKRDGKIKYAGFSYHDGLPLFKKIIDSYKWDVAQIQLNILDASYQAGEAGLRYASERGISVVIMEPLKGGMLAMPIEGTFSDVAEKYGYDKPTFVDLCLKWVWSYPQVGVVLSGMGSMRQLDENIASASDIVSGKNTFSQSDNRLVSEIRAIYQSRVKVGCTGCAYCRPCPKSVDILECFRLYNEASITGNWKGRQFAYNNVMFPPTKAEKRASECVGCGICETRCPQNLHIRESLKDVVKAFEETSY